MQPPTTSLEILKHINVTIQHPPQTLFTSQTDIEMVNDSTYVEKWVMTVINKKATSIAPSSESNEKDKHVRFARIDNAECPAEVKFQVNWRDTSGRIDCSLLKHSKVSRSSSIQYWNYWIPKTKRSTIEKDQIRSSTAFIYNAAGHIDPWSDDRDHRKIMCSTNYISIQPPTEIGISPQTFVTSCNTKRHSLVILLRFHLNRYLLCLYLGKVSTLLSI